MTRDANLPGFSVNADSAAIVVGSATAANVAAAPAIDSAGSGAPAEGSITAAVAVPVTAALDSAMVPALDIASRAASQSAYQRHYLPARAASLDWSGSVSGCVLGATSGLWRNSVLRQVNFARALAGLPGSVRDDAVLSGKAQAAALMMQANHALNHQPPTTWTCYSAAGAEAAGASNLALGTALIGTTRSIDLYLSDDNVASLGHRRWVLYPPQVVMGTGDTSQANALWVFGPHDPASSSNLAPDGTAWPPNGFVPRTLVSSTMAWSFSLAQADFSQARVTVRDGTGQALALTQWIADVGYGDNTLAFRPASGTWAVSATSDSAFDVSITGVRAGGVSRAFSWRTTVFTPS